MTNQQGAPEALRLADAIDPFERKSAPDHLTSKVAADELRRLHAENERLQQELIRESHRTAEQKLRADRMTRQHADQAAMNREARAQLATLVEAQQPATNVQNTAEIEHVAGDVSKNGAESNMAQQPAPSAAVFGLRLVPVEPTDQMVQAAHHIDLSYMPGQEGADRAAIYRAMIAAAPQPAVQQWNDLIGKETHADADGLLVWRDEVDFAIPKPQADSAPAAAPADTVVLEAALCAIHQAIDLIGEPDTERLRTVRRVLRGAVVVAEDSNAPQADSQPAPKGETNVQLDIDSNHSTPEQQRDVAGSVALGQPVGNGSDQAAGHTGAQGDKLLIVAERNIRSFLRSAVFKSESDREAALNCVDVLWEAASAPADSVLDDAARAGFFLQLPQRPKPEAPAGTVGLDWDAYSGAQMLAYGRDCSNAAIVATQKSGGA